MTVLTRLRRRLFGHRPPPVLTARLEGDERVAAWAMAVDGTPVAATTRALLFSLDGQPYRFGWHEIHKASWADGSLTITPAKVLSDDDSDHQVVADADPIVVELTEHGKLPPQVRIRVTRSVAYTAHHTLPAGGGARIVGRRVPGVDGVSWAVRYDSDADPTAPENQATVADLFTTARQSLG